MELSTKKPSVLFLCTGNSCRSQMAEGWLRALRGDQFEVYSAGIETHGLNSHAVAVMAEAGVDISQQQSKLLADVALQPDILITVCGHADETCPMLAAQTRKLHVGFDDPPRLAKTAETPEQALDHYRRVRDDIKHFVEAIDDYLA